MTEHLVISTPEARAIQGVVRTCMVSFHYFPSYSGSAVQAETLSRHLQALDVKSMVVSANLTDSPAHETLNGLPVHRLAVIRSGWFMVPSFWLSLAWFLFRKRRTYDIIHAHGALPHGIVSLVGRLLGKKTILKVAMANSCLAFARQGKLWGSLQRFMVRRFDRLIATSDEAHLECFATAIPRAHIRFMPNGVDLDKFRPPTSVDERRALRAELGLPEGPIVCFVGIVIPRKNVDGALRVWRRVRAQTDRGHLLLLGPIQNDPDGKPGAFYRQLQQYAAEHGLQDSVTFAGRRPDVHKYLRAADVFFFPSRQEGMANVLLEAMASGLPTVASAIGGTTDLLKHGVTGCLHGVDDEDGHASSIVKLLKDPNAAMRMGVAARETIGTRFSIRATAQGYRRLYDELLGDESGASLSNGITGEKSSQ